MKSQIVFIFQKKHAIYIKQYIECTNESEGRFFRKFTPNLKSNKAMGKFEKQVMGKNTIAKIPAEIAKFLNLPASDSYTGHSFRRTSATIFADAGATAVDLKKHLNWKSDAVVIRYIDKSDAQKLHMSSIISSEPSSSSRNNPSHETLNQKTMHISNCSNVVINF